jgi:hypothetical protein
VGDGPLERLVGGGVSRLRRVQVPDEAPGLRQPEVVAELLERGHEPFCSQLSALGQALRIRRLQQEQPKDGDIGNHRRVAGIPRQPLGLVQGLLRQGEVTGLRKRFAERH